MSQHTEALESLSLCFLFFRLVVSSFTNFSYNLFDHGFRGNATINIMILGKLIVLVPVSHLAHIIMWKDKSTHLSYFPFIEVMWASKTCFMESHKFLECLMLMNWSHFSLPFALKHMEPIITYHLVHVLSNACFDKSDYWACLFVVAKKELFYIADLSLPMWWWISYLECKSPS